MTFLSDPPDTPAVRAGDVGQRAVDLTERARELAATDRRARPLERVLRHRAPDLVGERRAFVEEPPQQRPLVAHRRAVRALCGHLVQRRVQRAAVGVTLAGCAPQALRSMTQRG